jgi:uncharacterized LabA/DUF88 family protein
MDYFNNFLFFDGSALIAQIKQLQEARPLFKEKKLDALILVQGFTSDRKLHDIMGDGYRRAVFYFAEGDKQPDSYLILPDFTKIGTVRDVEFRFCGSKLPRSAKYEKFLQSVPPEFLDRCQKSEKGVDIEICCDALQLTATGRLDRLFLLTNDSDFLPLCRKVKELGANISLLRLSDARPVNRDLAAACDSYDVFPENMIAHAFGLAPAGTTVEVVGANLTVISDEEAERNRALNEEKRRKRKASRHKLR